MADVDMRDPRNLIDKGYIQIGKGGQDASRVLRKEPVYDRQIACLGDGAHAAELPYFTDAQNWTPTLNATEAAIYGSQKKFARDHNIPSRMGVTGQHEVFWMTGVSVIVDAVGTLNAAGAAGFGDDIRRLRSFGHMTIGFGLNSTQTFTTRPLGAVPFRSKARPVALTIAANANNLVQQFSEPGMLDLRVYETAYLLESFEEIVAKLIFTSKATLLTPNFSIIWDFQLEGFRGYPTHH